MAKSLAFWLEGNNSKKTNIELHFNFWSLNDNEKHSINYLDVGVKFLGAATAEYIKVYFPFLVPKEKYVSSLGAIICGQSQLLPAIFNTNVKSVNPGPERTDSTFQNEQDSKLRFHWQIELGNPGEGVSLEDVVDANDSGTILSFPMKLFRNSTVDFPNEEERPNYFRFRVKISNDDKNTLSQTYRSKDAKVLSRLESTEVVDFRVNEIRNLPPKIRSRLESDSCITAVHFFLIRETHSEHKLSHTEFKRCRVLEKSLWDPYLRTDPRSNLTIPEQMLIYHWKESVTNEDGSETLRYLDNFSAFAKFSKTTVSTATLAGFILTIIALGVISGVTGNFLYGALVSSEEPSCNVQPESTSSIEDPKID